MRGYAHKLTEYQIKTPLLWEELMAAQKCNGIFVIKSIWFDGSSDNLKLYFQQDAGSDGLQRALPNKTFLIIGFWCLSYFFCRAVLNLPFWLVLQNCYFSKLSFLLQISCLACLVFTLFV